MGESADRSVQIQQLLDRLRQGDDSARSELIGCAYERLRILAKRIFHQDFPRLECLHETGSVLNATVLRLLGALQEVKPATVRDFFSFAAVQIRRVLLNMARSQDRHRESGYPPAEIRDPSPDPVSAALWVEFHEKVEALPPAEREVVDLYLYQELTQAEAAKILGLPERAVSRLWTRARLKLAAWVPELDSFFGKGG